jgi:hypothetical protein
VAIVRDGVGVPRGRVVLRVHHHDTRSPECAPAERDVCAAAIVVEEVAWSGDEWTETTPLTIADVARRLDAAGISVTLNRSPEAWGGDVCPADWPPERWLATESGVREPLTSHVWRIGVFATTADRQRVQSTLTAHGTSGAPSNGEPCNVVFDSAGGEVWVEQDNVIVGVPFRWDEPEPDVETRVDRVRSALGQG